MHGLTRYVGFSDTKIKAGEGAGIKRILLCRPNSRLGNQLMITPLVQECIARFPGCRIDLFVRGSLAEIIFKNYEETDRIIELPRKPFRQLGQYLKVWLSLRQRRYDLAVNVTEGSSSGRLATRFARARWRLFNNTDPRLDWSALFSGYGHMAQNPVYNLRLCLPLSRREQQGPVPPLSLRLSAGELANGRKVLRRYADDTKPVICLYTFATGLKCYSKEWWAVMYAGLKEAFGDRYHLIEVLPAENVSQIDFCAPSYYSRDLREIASVIANSALFVGADSGIMHLAAASGTPVAGLFSVTEMYVYRPYGGLNLAINTNRTNTDRIIVELNMILKDNN
jgi:ADP-heptose:LPS heptosyltransferase